MVQGSSIDERARGSSGLVCVVEQLSQDVLSNSSISGLIQLALNRHSHGARVGIYLTPQTVEQWRCQGGI